jgi:hypothetical protein
MKTAGRRNPNRWAIMPRTPSLWRGRSEQLSLVHVGWKARKTPAAGEVFFLDFPLYRTYQAPALPSHVGRKQRRDIFRASMGWESIFSDAIGVALLCLGTFGKNLKFRARHSREPIPTWKGRLLAIVVGAFFLFVGLSIQMRR